MFVTYQLPDAKTLSTVKNITEGFLEITKKLDYPCSVPGGVLFAPFTTDEEIPRLLSDLLTRPTTASGSDNNLKKEDDNLVLINSWKSSGLSVLGKSRVSKPGWVYVYHNKKTEAVSWKYVPSSSFKRRISLSFSTLLVLNNFCVEDAELVALDNLKAHLTDEQKRTLCLSGTITQIGKSGVTYIIRRNLPTLAMRLVPGTSSVYNFLASLCFHPQGFYTDTFVGALPPSDEMFAHLMFIKGDEYTYWKKANQHRIDEVEAGI